MELKELASTIGVKNILVTHINSTHYKNFITVIVNNDLAFNLMGKTIYFIPLTKEGIGKELSSKGYSSILNRIKLELRKESF